jgi:hypothetical protein
MTTTMTTTRTRRRAGRAALRLGFALGAMLPLALLAASAARAADDCPSGSELEFEAETEAGHPFPSGLLVKLRREQCGVVALWLPPSLVQQQPNCKFGDVFTVFGSGTRPVPANRWGLTGKMLVVFEMECD